jgi:hypothetical protein
MCERLRTGGWVAARVRERTCARVSRGRWRLQHRATVWNQAPFLAWQGDEADLRTDTVAVALGGIVCPKQPSAVGALHAGPAVCGENKRRSDSAVSPCTRSWLCHVRVSATRGTVTPVVRANCVCVCVRGAYQLRGGFRR